MAYVRVGRVTILRSPTMSFYSTKAAPSASNFTRAAKYIAGAGVVSVPGFWYFTTGRNEAPPHLDGMPAEELLVRQGPSKDEVTRMISQEKYSYQHKIGGVSRYDGTRVASNSPCEDQYIHGTFPSPWKEGSKWIAWGVLDGHSGWQAADLLQKQLLPFVRHGLSQIKPNADREVVSDEKIGDAIKKAFVKLDDSILKNAVDASQGSGSLQDKLANIAPAFAGSCALLSIYDPTTCKLHVACTGDSRAVLGQQNANGKWEAIPLSIDQTGDNEAEIARLKKEHPGEEEIIAGGRVLGIMVSRAFGDSRWKWPVDLQKELKKKFEGPWILTPKYKVLTPPYLTAEPVVTSTRIDTGKPSFLIMATDGLWDDVSNQQAVDLVAKWLETPVTLRKDGKTEPKYEPYDFSNFEWKEQFVEGRTTVQDDNAAVHLVRNSLGGNHQEMIAGRLAYGTPFCRNIRDDITVQVVFFNVPGQ
ncbi:phosphatase 2C-like domain-containing protein [Rhexocercosporidium sp. MPI-PUGE-AT-0058]|nr:phosphatase 2C-like domain-containing protein [Rhexocercosporidium sp. MPI-PUGE-AT-0058]